MNTLLLIVNLRERSRVFPDILRKKKARDVIRGHHISTTINKMSPTFALVNQSRLMATCFGQSEGYARCAPLQHPRLVSYTLLLGVLERFKYAIYNIPRD